MLFISNNSQVLTVQKINYLYFQKKMDKYSCYNLLFLLKFFEYKIFSKFKTTYNIGTQFIIV